jgi:integrase
VDLSGAQLHIRQTMQRNGGDPVIRHKRFDEQKRLGALLKTTEPARGSSDQGAADLARLLPQRRALMLTIATATDQAIRDQAQADLADNARARGRALRMLKTGKPDPARDALRAQRAKAREELRKVQSVVTPGEPKTPRSRRTIALPALVVKALEAHRKRQLETRLAAGRHWHEHGLVFTSRIGTPIDGRNLHATYKGVLRAAGLPDIRFHDLRHTAATLLLAQGVSPRTIMETLGHSQISLTLDTYAHVLPALQEDAARKMDAILTVKGA